ncbi:MAG TPA: hypothetical protein DG761_08260 [Gammaproteobacteria bacterium]|nr:hypothetical protein [Gammaproteobacteria bacterium]
MVMRFDSPAPASPLQPRPAVAEGKRYAIPPKQDFIDLPLGNTERVVISQAEKEIFEEIVSQLDVSAIAQYPKLSGLQKLLAERLGVMPERVLVTAGADEALERAIGSVLGSGRELIATSPTFEMIPIYARLTGGSVQQVPWLEGAFPADGVLDAVTDDTTVISVVTPSNPTGAVVPLADLQRIALAVPHILLLVDLAYVEFADVDITANLLDLANVVIVRSLSKAWGMPGVRVGYAVGDAEVISWMSRTSGPYSVSGPSLAIAEARVRRGDESVREYVRRVRAERKNLAALIAEFGGMPMPSQANFVLARFENAAGVSDDLAARGIGTRRFPDNPDLKDALRITCPGDEHAFGRLTNALRAALDPKA